MTTAEKYEKIYQKAVQDNFLRALAEGNPNAKARYYEAWAEAERWNTAFDRAENMSDTEREEFSKTNRKIATAQKYDEDVASREALEEPNVRRRQRDDARALYQYQMSEELLENCI